MKLTRKSGILLHPTSLPGPHGCGDLGTETYNFVNWLVSARQSLWQMLPLGDIGAGNSPYMSPSAFGGNVLLISLEKCRDAGWLNNDELIPDSAFETARVNYPAVSQYKIERLKLASKRFFESAEKIPLESFLDFCRKAAFWLDNYALFKSITEVYKSSESGWQTWPEPLVQRDKRALSEFADSHAEEIRFWKFCQWCFHEQWTALHAYCHSINIDIIGDVPIFVSLNSADVWANPELFELDTAGFPTAVAGVPPDKFSDSGQHWGNPLYRWKMHAGTGYNWWIRRMQYMLELYDTVRIDHFRGFQAYWAIPADAKEPSEGQWLPGPGDSFFDALQKEFGSLGFIAEDLGVITPAVNDLRKKYELPGMRILQFAFDHNPDNPYLPHNYKPDTVVYTGTHDNDTARGWWNSLSEWDRDFARRYLSINGDWIQWDLIRSAWSSTAAFSLTPYQDILGLGSQARMNTPGNSTGAWEWRFSWNQVEGWYAGFLAQMTEIYGRTYSRH